MRLHGRLRASNCMALYFGRFSLVQLTQRPTSSKPTSLLRVSHLPPPRPPILLRPRHERPPRAPHLRYAVRNGHILLLHQLHSKQLPLVRSPELGGSTLWVKGEYNK